MGLHFEWDTRKAAQNWTKHRVSFDEATTVFGDPNELLISDPDHSYDEERLISVGLSSANRLLVVCYVESGSTIRIISAREAETGEVLSYRRVSR